MSPRGVPMACQECGRAYMESDAIPERRLCSECRPEPCPRCMGFGYYILGHRGVRRRVDPCDVCKGGKEA